MPKFLVEARNANYERIGVIEQYTSLEVISRYNAVGSWTLALPGGSLDASLLQPGCGIIVWIDGLPRPVMSGPLTSVSHKWSAEQPGKGEVVYSGVSDETALWQRVTLPVPANATNEQTQDRFMYSAPAATALAHLVTLNAGPGARPDRRIPKLDVPTPGDGRRVEVSTRFDVLGQKLQEIAASAGVGWRLRQGVTDRLTFETFIPRNRSTQAVFSAENGNLASFDYSLTAPTASRFIVAAQGEGRFRWINEYDDGASRYLNNTNPRVEYTGAGWTYGPNRKKGDFFNDVHYSPTVGDAVTFTFTGKGVKFITERSPDAGSVDVYLDDKLVQTVNLNQASPTYQVVGWEKQDLVYGDHRLRLVHKGPNKLIVDAFHVTGLPTVATDWYRYPLERFVDRRDIPVQRGNDGTPINPQDGSPADPKALSQLDQAADEVVSDSAATAQLSITPVDTPSLRYGFDYEIGDVVSVVVDGEVITDVLREVRLKDGTDGPSIQPVIGNDGASETPNIYRELKRLWSSLKKLEARR